jgi:hypothetical protein
MCNAAVGSGAFPAAFRPKAIQRSVEDFGVRLPVDQSLWIQGKTYVDWIGASPADFAYSDGGVLQNQPLGIAKNLVDAAVADRGLRLGPAAFCDENDRLYVFVAPHSVKSTAHNFTAANVTIWSELKQLVSVFFRQAMFHDWIIAEGVNLKINLLDERATELAEVISRGLLDIAALVKTSSDLNGMLMPNQEQARLTRLREQYSVEYNKVLTALDSQAAEAFVSALATLEAAAHLESRDKMKIVAVTADAQKELAGSGFAAFLGFFKKSFRQHDYWIGRVKTRAYLQRSDVKTILGVEQWPEEKLWGTDLPNPSGVTLPLSKIQVVGASVVPAIIMVLIRPLLLIILLIAGGGLGLLLWYLAHR